MPCNPEQHILNPYPRSHRISSSYKGNCPQDSEHRHGWKPASCFSLEEIYPVCTWSKIPQWSKDALWAQRLDLGWVVIGNACSNSAHKPRKIATFKNHFLDNGRPSFMELCPSLLYLECEAALNDASSATCQKKRHLVNELFEGNLGTSALVRTKDDNKPGTSVDDRTFVQITHESQAC